MESGEGGRVPLTTVVHAPEPRSRFGRWLMHGASPEEAGHHHGPTHPWTQVLWLTGVDYFSTLGYQPGIALLAAGAISPVATLVLILLTLFGALPIYREVARRSYSGQGSIAMLESLLAGWKGKLFVLVLLGFAATDFVITMTLSAADAAEHLVENPLVSHYLHGGNLWITLALLAMLAAVFLKGFKEAIGLAVTLGVLYMGLNVVVTLRCLVEVFQHPDMLTNWQGLVHAKGSPVQVGLLACLVFPKLALGLSGFETGVSVMPLVAGDPEDDPAGVPHGRIRNSGRLLTAAAVLMSVMLLGTSFVTAVLVPEEAYRTGGPASGRVLAYLTHRLMGSVMGTVYDISTILILWFAGASAMAGLLNVIPRYLPRFGMAPRWVSFARPLVLALFAVAVLVTCIFHADVEKQAGAYATGVLVLMLSAAVAVALALGREGRGEPENGGSPRAPDEQRRARRRSVYFWAVAVIFGYTLVQNVHERPDGLFVASAFILGIVLLSGLSRYLRATELRVEDVVLADPASEELWRGIVRKKVNLVPLKHAQGSPRERKAAEIRAHYKIAGPLAFLHVHLRDDRSQFSGRLEIRVRRLGEDYMVDVYGATALANTIAYVSELLDPIRIFLGLTRQNSVGQAFRYLLYGEGETGILVYEILLRHWEMTPEDDVRPLIFLMSE